MKRPSFNAVAVESARRVAESRGLEVNLLDAKGNTQNIVLSETAVTHVLTALFQKRLPDPTKDFFLDESIPLAGVGTFVLASGHTGLRLYLNPQEVFDVSFAPDILRGLNEVFGFLAQRSADETPA